MPRKSQPKKDGPESGEDSDEYRKRRDRNNLVCITNAVIYRIFNFFMIVIGREEE